MCPCSRIYCATKMNPQGIQMSFFYYYLFILFSYLDKLFLISYDKNLKSVIRYVFLLQLKSLAFSVVSTLISGLSSNIT